MEPLVAELPFPCVLESEGDTKPIYQLGRMFRSSSYTPGLCQHLGLREVRGSGERVPPDPLLRQKAPSLHFWGAMPWQPDAADFRMGGFGPTAGKVPLLWMLLQRARGKQQASYPGTSYPGTSYPEHPGGFPGGAILPRFCPKTLPISRFGPLLGDICLNLNSRYEVSSARSCKCGWAKSPGHLSPEVKSVSHPAGRMRP